MVIASLLAFALMPVVEALRRERAGAGGCVAPIVLIAAGHHRDHDDRVGCGPDDRPGPAVQQGHPEDRRPARRAARSSGRACAKPTRRRRSGSGSTTFPKRLDVNSTPIADAAGNDRRRHRGHTVRAAARDHARARRRTPRERWAGNSCRRRRRPTPIASAASSTTSSADTSRARCSSPRSRASSRSSRHSRSAFRSRRCSRCGSRSATRCPQIGGFLGAVPFVALGLTQGAVTGVICLVVFLIYQQIENHVLQPLIIGRAVRLTPPATMVAALIGVAAGGVVGGMLAIPLLGASQGDLPGAAVARPGTTAPGWVPPSEHLPLATPPALRRGRERRGEEAAVHDVRDRVEHRVGVELEPARHEEVREPFEHRHERGDRRVVARRAPASRMRRSSAFAMSVNERTPSALDLAVLDVALHPGPDDRAVAAVGARRTARGTRAARGSPSASGPIGPSVSASASDLVSALDVAQRAEQIFLVREVQVERAVRRARRPHDVVDTRGVKAAIARTRACPASSSRRIVLRPCGAQLARLRRRARSPCAHADASSHVAWRGDLYASLMLPHNYRRSRTTLRRSYRLRHRARLAALLRRHRSHLRRGRRRARAARASAKATSSRSCCRRASSTCSRTARRPSSARSPPA